MPQRTTKTNTQVYSSAIGGAVFEGRVWAVKPNMPSPNDATTQAAAYRTLNRNKSANVAAWLGIRYGQAPIGALRFKPCVAYTYAAGNYLMTAQPAPPYQRFAEELDSNGRTRYGMPLVGAYDWVGFGAKEAEDCATLNIFAPSGLTGRPVVVHFHGGAWGVYHAMGPQQIGDVLAAHKGCVVVTVEYPLSTFGHFPHPDLLASGEPSTAYTFMRMALKWVYDNITAFGGDPAKVVISGSSAGGAAVQLFLEDDTAQTWFSAAWIGSGGGTAQYLNASYYTPKTKRMERAIRVASPGLWSSHPSYLTVADAIAAMGFAWTMQNAMPVGYVQALADARKTPTPASVIAAQSGGDLVIVDVPTDNFYPFRRGSYYNAIEAAKAGKFRKPFVSLYAECEALNLMGGDYVSIRTSLLGLSTATLDGWAQRLGYSNYAGWVAGAWQPVGGLEGQSSAQFKTSIDPLCIDCENRRVLYTHAVFGYAAWRVARAATSTASAAAYLCCNNFSANSTWAGHSQEVALMFGQIEWLVAGLVDFPAADPAGIYANNRMDGIYASEMMMQALAAMAATGNPGGAYSYAGFDLFSDVATRPDPYDPMDPNNIYKGAQYVGTWTAFDLANQDKVNVFGKYFDPINNLNAGTFGAGGDIVAGLDGTRDARLRYVSYMGAAMAEYRLLLEGV